MIDFNNVTKIFGAHMVLDDLTIHIPKGKITVIVGKSGEGKSVTIKHIMGLLRPTKGEVIVGGENIGNYDQYQLREYRKKFGMLFQQAALFDGMTVGENVAFPLREHTKMPLTAILERAEEVLEQTGLPGIQHKYPAELSTGEKKRVGLARALVAHPHIILYDEPTSELDPMSAVVIGNEILDLNRRIHVTSLVVSHDRDLAFGVADRIAVIIDGQIVTVGTPDEVKQFNDPRVKDFLHADFKRDQ